jgi:hypothetical protein
MEKDFLKEILAKIAHENWGHWMKYLFQKGKFDSDGNFVIPKEFVEKWKKQMETKFENLTQEEQKSDFEIAEYILERIKNYEK